MSSDFVAGMKALKESDRQERAERRERVTRHLRDLEARRIVRLLWFTEQHVRGAKRDRGSAAPFFDLWPSTGRWRRNGERRTEHGWERFLAALGVERSAAR